jgi:hypothetical protein
MRLQIIKRMISTLEGFVIHSLVELRLNKMILKSERLEELMQVRRCVAKEGFCA